MLIRVSRHDMENAVHLCTFILPNGCDLILNCTFDRIGFNRIKDEVFRNLAKARLESEKSPESFCLTFGAHINSA